MGLLAARDGNAAEVATAVACCLVPIGTVVACVIWSMGARLIEPCNPFVDGCTSISRACRQQPVILLFRTTMLPAAALLALFWWQEHARLARLLPRLSIRRRVVSALAFPGTAFLVLYVLFLGTDGPVYEFLRRTGIYVFFAGTGIAQLIKTLLMDRDPAARVPRVAHRSCVALTVAMLMLGPLNLLLKATLANPDAAENVIEWWFGLAMFSWFGLCAIVRRHDTRDGPDPIDPAQGVIANLDHHGPLQ